MTTHLHAALYGTPLGTISGKDWWSADITFTPDALSRWDVGSCVLSAAAPLQVTPRKAHAERRRNVFAELLPEGVTRERLARTAGVPTNDVVGLLTHYGRDVAGALAVADPRADGEPPTPQLVTLPEATLHELVSAPLEARLGNHPSLGRTSLAGVQGKLALARSRNGEWLRPTGGAVSPPTDSTLRQLVGG